MRNALHIVALAAALGAHVPRTFASEAEKCYSSWSEAAPIVKREQLATAKEIHEQVRKRNLGEPIRITLCEEKGRFAYRLMLQDGSGKVKNLTIDARRPF